jgi:hypothetical protein
MELIDLFVKDGDDSGVSGIALVDSPAIEVGWNAFNSQQRLKKYTIQLAQEKGNFKAFNGEQQVLAGALMIPNKQIYRKEIDPETKKEREFEVRFKPEVIAKIQEKFAIANRNTAINEMHNANMPVNAALVQHFIIDRKAGINPPFGEDLPDGTWYGYIKVFDKAKWDTFIKTGIYTGFSVEGQFYEQPSTVLTKEEEALFNDLLGEVLGH